MNAQKKILILDTGSATSPVLTELAGAMTALGASVAVRALDKRYDEILDAVAAADTVVCWR
jgi:hypothetical protein